LTFNETFFAQFTSNYSKFSWPGIMLYTSNKSEAPGLPGIIELMSTKLNSFSLAFIYN